MTGRRSFIATAGGLVAAAGAAAIVDAPYVIAQPKIQWRISTAWPPQLDNLQKSAEQLGNLVAEMSGGRFTMQVYPGGQIMPPFACFDATSKGEIEAFMAAGTYWVDRDVATSWSGRVGIALASIIILMALFAPLIAPYGPNEVLLDSATNEQKLEKPCVHALGCDESEVQHLMGTDENGRDEFSRVVYGARTSLVAGAISVVLAVIVQVWLPPGVLERWLPRAAWARRAVLSLLGMLIPVCECGNVPFARGLLMRGFSVPETLTFLMAAPIVNPIVIITTHQAFGFSDGILIARLLGGYAIANLIGWLYSRHPDPGSLLTPRFALACASSEVGHGGSRGRRSVTQLLV